jgi:cytochrome c-type biogenesis protein CcmH/NrfG
VGWQPLRYRTTENFGAPDLRRFIQEQPLDPALRCDRLAELAVAHAHASRAHRAFARAGRIAPRSMRAGTYA